MGAINEHVVTATLNQGHRYELGEIQYRIGGGIFLADRSDEVYLVVTEMVSNILISKTFTGGF
jgi:hypothetical protein